MNAGAPEGSTVPVLFVPPIVLLLNDTLFGEPVFDLGINGLCVKLHVFAFSVSSYCVATIDV
jgi:hypothetical protein